MDPIRAREVEAGEEGGEAMTTDHLIEYPKVLVRAYGEEPVSLWAVRATRTIVQVVGEKGSTPIGFPADRVYEFNDETFARLKRLYENGGVEQLAEAWDGLTHFRRE